jgi:hypothetical protein
LKLPQPITSSKAEASVASRKKNQKRFIAVKGMPR